MNRHILPGPSGGSSLPRNPRDSFRDDLDHSLVSLAQEYLRTRRLGVEPEPEEAEAWAVFYDVADPIVRSSAHARRRSSSEIADAAQEVWCVIVLRLPDYRHDPDRGRFCDWLRAVGRHALTNRDRSAACRPFESLETIDADELLGREEDPAVHYAREEGCPPIRRAFGSLLRRVDPPAFRAVYLHWLEGWTADEIADRLGLSYGQVWGYLTRLKEKLRKLYEQEGGSAERPE